MTARILAAAVLLALGAAAHAGAPQALPELDPAASTQATQTVGSAAERDTRCLRHTGSRIGVVESRRAARQARAGQSVEPPCNHRLAGRAYQREDLERTGAIDLADALRRLDPSVY